MAETPMIGELLMCCLHARTAAHVMHLKTRSYSEHLALQGFYEDIVPLVDTLAEAYQGEYGLIKEYPEDYKSWDSPLTMLDDLRECLDECAKECFDKQDTHLNNAADELRSLIASTAYKLRFLR